MFEIYKISSGKGCNRRSWVHADILYITFAFHKKWGTYFTPHDFYQKLKFLSIDWCSFHFFVVEDSCMLCWVFCSIEGFLAFKQARNFIVLGKNSKTQKFQIFFVLILLFFSIFFVCYTMTSMFFVSFYFSKKLRSWNGNHP
jgi:hypothetical protein